MADNIYDNLELQDDTTYATIEPKKAEDLHKILRSDRRRNRRVGVGVGLLCAVLALLNVAVPLYLYQSNMVERQQLLSSFEQLQTRYDLLTEERDDIKMRLCESLGWLTVDRGCYFISTERKNWQRSRQWCIDNQSDLIVINGKEMQDHVTSLNKTVWLGLTDRDEEGIWIWVDGTPLTTPTYWGPGQPNDNRGGDDCVEFDASRGRDGGWNDIQCSNLNYWICERVVW